MTVKWYARLGDAKTPVEATLSANGAQDLTGLTVEFHATRLGSTGASISGAAVLGNQVTNPGKVTYTLTASDLDPATHQAGTYKVEWQVTFPGGITATWPLPGFDELQIEPQLA